MRVSTLFGLFLLVFLIRFSYCEDTDDEGEGEVEEEAGSPSGTVNGDENDPLGENQEDDDDEEEKSKYTREELEEMFKLSHYPEYFIEGGMMNFSYAYTIKEDQKERFETFTEDILITQSGIYDIHSNDNYLLFHTGKFFSAAILSPLIPSHFKFLDAAESYIVIYDFTDLMSKPFKMLYNVQVLEHVLRLLSENVIPFLPSHERPDYSRLLVAHGVPFRGDIFYEPGKDLTITFSKDDDPRGKFVYVFNDDDVVHNMEVLQLKTEQQTITVHNYDIQVSHNSITIKNLLIPPGFYVGYEVQKSELVEHHHILSSSGNIIPADVVTVTPATDPEHLITWEFKKSSTISSFEIHVHFTHLRVLHLIGDCFLGTVEEACKLNEHSHLKEFQDLQPTSLKFTGKHSHKIYVKFALTYMNSNISVVVRTSYFCAYNCEKIEPLDISHLEVPKTEGEKIVTENVRNTLNKLQIAEDTLDLNIKFTLASESLDELNKLLENPEIDTLPDLKTKLKVGLETATSVVATTKKRVDDNKQVIEEARKMILAAHKKHTECFQLEDLVAQVKACDEADRLAEEAKKLCRKIPLTYDEEIMEELHSNIKAQRKIIKTNEKKHKLEIASAQKLETEGKEFLEKGEKEGDAIDKLYNYNAAIEVFTRAKRTREEAKDSKDGIASPASSIDLARSQKEKFLKSISEKKEILKSLETQIHNKLQEAKQNHETSLEKSNSEMLLSVLTDLLFKAKIFENTAHDLQLEKLEKEFPQLSQKIQTDISQISSNTWTRKQKEGHFNLLTIILLIFLIISLSTMVGLVGVYWMKNRRYRARKTIVISDSVSAI